MCVYKNFKFFSMISSVEATSIDIYKEVERVFFNPLSTSL